MITYDIGKRIDLSLKKLPISKEKMSAFVKSVHTYGQASGNKKPKITVQIVAYNEGSQVVDNIKKLLNQNYKDLEIILVDNGLDNQTRVALKKLPITHIIATHNLGCTLGRNLGAAYSSGEVLVFIDADGFVADNYLDTVEKAMSDTKRVAVRGRVLGINGKPSSAAHYDLGDQERPSIIDTEGNSAWRRKDFLKVGGFEASLAGGEGLVICYRMFELYGYDYTSFYYVPDMVLFHDFHNDKKHLKGKMRKYALIRDQINKKYPRASEFQKLYSKHQLTYPRYNKDATVVALSKKETERVQKEWRQYYESLKEKRLANPALVKNKKSYDFSVIIPCYNLGGLVWSAVESVMKQSVDSVEIIVVDDKSSDEETLKELKELEKHVKVIYQKENRGVAAARNAGVAVAKSKYILCLDADDTIEPTYLEKAINLFEADPNAVIVTSGAKYFGGKEGLWVPKDKLTVRNALAASPVPTASCFTKDDWQASGGYDEVLRGYEDWSFWISLLKMRGHSRTIPEPLFNYYVRPGGKVNTSNKNSINLVMRIIEKHNDVFKKYYPEVIAEKHKQMVELRSQVDALRARRIRTLLLNTKLGRAAKYIVLGSQSSAKKAALLIRDGDFQTLIKLGFRKIRSLSKKLTSPNS